MNGYILFSWSVHKPMHAAESFQVLNLQRATLDDDDDKRMMLTLPIKCPMIQCQNHL